LEAIRRGEVEKACAALPNADAQTRRAIEAMSQAIVNKILHTPTVKLRERSRGGHGRTWTEMVHELFGLGGRGEEK
jgi:glutamyl-tRNA reductase